MHYVQTHDQIKNEHNDTIYVTIFVYGRAHFYLTVPGKLSLDVFFFLCSCWFGFVSWIDTLQFLLCTHYFVCVMDRLILSIVVNESQFQAIHKWFVGLCAHCTSQFKAHTESQRKKNAAIYKQIHNSLLQGIHFNNNRFMFFSSTLHASYLL